MCFYDYYQHTCGDWKWGHFRRHCQAEYRRGETCGMRLMNNKLELDTKCTLCDKYEVKARKLKNRQEKFERMRRNNELPATRGVLKKEIVDLTEEINTIIEALTARRTNVGTRG